MENNLKSGERVVLLQKDLPYTRHSLIVTVQNLGRGLLPHFLNHYRNLGVKRFLFGVQDVPNQDELMRELGKCGDDVFVVARMIGYHPCGYVMVNAIRENVASDWFLVPDLDEFQKYPMRLDEMLDSLEQNGCNCILGRLVDRITPDGYIPEGLTSQDIMEQFPVSVLFSEHIMKQDCRKVMLAKKDLMLNIGKHSAKDEKTLSENGIVWHVKWFGNIKEELKIIRDWRKRNRLYFKTEGDFAMKHLEENNGIKAEGIEFYNAEKKKRGDVIVLTSALKVSSPNHVIKDTKVRLIQYLHSLILFSKTRVQDLIFCDNSGMELNLSILKELFRTQDIGLEILLFKETLSTHNYGLLEHNILKHILENSQAMKKHKSFYKVTGRLYIENMNDILDAERDNENVFSEEHNGYLDTRCFKISKEVFRQSLWDDSAFALEKSEEIYWDRVQQRSHFKHRPIVVGRAGWSGQVYDRDYYADIWNRAMEMAKEVIS